jgi:hypothetical protein
VQNLLDETAIDLEEVNGEVLEVTKRRQTGTEVIKCKSAADLL